MSDLITFEILWYSGGSEHAPNRVIARNIIRRRDLSAAITTACNMMRSGKGADDGYAHGFYVRKERTS